MGPQTLVTWDQTTGGRQKKDGGGIRPKATSPLPPCVSGGGGGTASLRVGTQNKTTDPQLMLLLRLFLNWQDFSDILIRLLL